MLTIAVITIGQAPRPDIAQDLKKLLPEDFHITEYGALDGFSRRQAEERFGYRGRGELLITRLGGSGEVLQTDGEAIMKQLQTCIHRAEADGTDAAMIACTGIFPPYEHQIPLWLPGEAQRRHTLALAGEERIGVIIPKEDQREQIARWWRDSGAENILLGIADPYGDPGQIPQTAAQLKAAGARVLCLDCFGYTLEQQQIVQQVTGLTAVLPREVLAREMAQTLAGITPTDCAVGRQKR